MKKVDCVKEANEILKANKIADADISIKFILGMAMGVSTHELIGKNELTDKEYKKFMKLIKLRSRHVPLDKIIGYKNFLNLTIPYDKNVLTPRFETELLAERVINDINNSNQNSKVVDLCTGSGCLGLAIAYNSNALVTLSDISKKAIKIAKYNNKYNSELCGKTVEPEFVLSDLFENIKDTFDIIVCNPPYVKSADLSKLEIEVRDFDPILALDGGKDGLDFYREIISQAPEKLNAGGKIYFEVGVNQSKPVAKLLNKNFQDIEIVKDYSGIERFVIAKKRD